MRIHILGICGTFMAGVAVLARQEGHTVSGSDQAFYPPMSDQLMALGISLHEGYSADALMPEPDLVIVGNTAKRGNPAVEWMLNNKIPYVSGPEWLYHEILSKQKTVLAVSGTHGKTTTSSMLAWILEKSGENPGFLIGGVPQNFGVSARLGGGKCFVLEADEYDTAFFDKRSKFVHYHPDILIINNLEFDHADIFPDLDAIQKQFHHMVRMMPAKGVILRPKQSDSIDETLGMGCWSHVQTFAVCDTEEETGLLASTSGTGFLPSALPPSESRRPSVEANNPVSNSNNWQAQCLQSDGSAFEVRHQEISAEIHWHLLGKHNVSNALAAIAAAHAAGVSIESASAALESFKNVKRRLEVKGKVNEITVYDDFAHHPTAIEATLDALRQHIGKQRLLAILHLASNSMRMGIYTNTLGPALQAADEIIVLKPADPAALDWVFGAAPKKIHVLDSVEDIVEFLGEKLEPHDHVLVMSNGDFHGIHAKILQRIS